MKIGLIIPPAAAHSKIPERVYGCTFTYYKQPPLPILYVASVLEQDGHEVVFKDFTETNSWDEFVRFVHGTPCDTYVFHTVLLAESTDLRAARHLLENTQANIVFYGPHPTLKPRNFLLSGRCYVARGEAEFSIRNLLRVINTSEVRKVKGISYLHDGKLVETETAGVIEDLDAIPFPARHLITDTSGYFNPKLEERPVTLILTSRGCSFRCYYCVPNAISWARELEWKRFNNGKKPPVMLRSPQNIVAEFKAIRSEGYKAVS